MSERRWKPMRESNILRYKMQKYLFTLFVGKLGENYGNV
jgi:hypothetical protein